MEHKEKLEERHYMVMVAAPELRRTLSGEQLTASHGSI
jgi:hypothetical protein